MSPDAIKDSRMGASDSASEEFPVSFQYGMDHGRPVGASKSVDRSNDVVGSLAPPWTTRILTWPAV